MSHITLTIELASFVAGMAGGGLIVAVVALLTH
jgi:hypothetical protein